jgi:hypothetical protein
MTSKFRQAVEGKELNLQETITLNQGDRAIMPQVKSVIVSLDGADFDFSLVGLDKERKQT